MEEAVQPVRGPWRENPMAGTLSGDGERRQVAKLLAAHCQEKPLGRDRVPVPETDTGRRGEDPQARERTLVKELCKMAP